PHRAEMARGCRGQEPACRSMRVLLCLGGGYRCHRHPHGFLPKQVTPGSVECPDSLSWFMHRPGMSGIGYLVSSTVKLEGHVHASAPERPGSRPSSPGVWELPGG